MHPLCQTTKRSMAEYVFLGGAVRDGDHVVVASKYEGRVRFLGRTHFADGIWAGIELTTPNGKNGIRVCAVCAVCVRCLQCVGHFMRAFHAQVCVDSLVKSFHGPYMCPVVAFANSWCLRWVGARGAILWV